MRRIVVALAGTISGLVMLFSYHTSLGASGTQVAVGTGTGTGNSAGSSTAGGSTSAAGGTPDPTASSSATSGSGSSPSAAATTKTVTGDTFQTQWGPVQVALTIKGAKITAVDAVQYPNGNPRDQEINSVALPILAQEALKAQTARIDMVSGATVTSDGYLQSLQSALDKANL